MKSKSIKAVLFAATLLFSATAAFGQSAFALNGSVIASGGGTATGGVYSVNGTIAQPLAGGRMTNGAYSLTSGFWATVQFVQTPGSPAIGGIKVSAGNIVISWPIAATNYRLQSTATAADPSSWVDWSESPVVVGDQNTVEFRPILNPPLRFFRLTRVEP